VPALPAAQTAVAAVKRVSVLAKTVSAIAARLIPRAAMQVAVITSLARRIRTIRVVSRALVRSAPPNHQPKAPRS
jgi:hypothetical protein